MKKQYDFRKMSFYQIWTRSFCDGNGDGIGDLYGVYDKLPYIKALGVDGIWFSPIYPSPNADYGYDISDYKNIHPDYGTLEQFKKVLDRAHELVRALRERRNYRPTTGTASSRALRGNITSREDSTICTFLPKNSPTSTWTTQRSAKRWRTSCGSGWIWAWTDSARTS